MAWEKNLFDIPGMLAGVDMSGLNGGTTSGYQSSAQFLFAKLTAADTVGIAGIADFPVGVIQTNPKAGSGYSNVGVEVRSLGVSKVVSSGTIAPGAIIGPDANGLAVARAVASSGGDAGHWCAGVVIEGGAVGELLTVYLLSPFILQF